MAGKRLKETANKCDVRGLLGSRLGKCVCARVCVWCVCPCVVCVVRACVRVVCVRGCARMWLVWHVRGCAYHRITRGSLSLPFVC